MGRSGTFCPNCGKLRHHPTKEDKTVTAGLEVDVSWFDSEANSRFSDPTDLYIFVNHCIRCGYTMQLLSGVVLPDDDTLGPRSLDTGSKEFESFEAYKEWLQTDFSPYTEEGLEKPIEIDVSKLIHQLETEL